MPEKFDEIEIRRHVKMKSAAGQIDVHCKDSLVGAWISKGKKSIGVVAERDMVYVCFYDDTGSQRVPVALTTRGIQIPDATGKAEFFEWSKVADLLRKV